MVVLVLCIIDEGVCLHLADDINQSIKNTSIECSLYIPRRSVTSVLAKLQISYPRKILHTATLPLFILSFQRNIQYQSQAPPSSAS